MTSDEALKIVNDNYAAANDSFLFYLHERDRFYADKFEVLCDAVQSLAGCTDSITAQKIEHSYQNILKEIIYHFDPHDSSHIKDLPENYTEYLEMFDCALAKFRMGGIEKREER